MSKELRRSLLIGFAFGVAIGGRMLVNLFSDKPLWTKLLSVLLFVMIVAAETYVYYRNFQFGKELNQYAEKYQLTPADVAEITGQGRYDFYYLKDNKTMVFYSASGKLRKEVLAKLAARFGERKDLE